MKRTVIAAATLATLATGALTACSSNTDTATPNTPAAPAASAPAASAPAATPHTFTLGQTYHATGVDFTVTAKRGTGTSLDANNNEVSAPYLRIVLHVVNHGGGAIGESTVAVEPAANGAPLTMSTAGNDANNAPDVLPGAAGDLPSDYVMPAAGSSLQIKVHPNGGDQSDAAYWTGATPAK